MDTGLDVLRQNRVKHFVDVLPETVKKIAVMDRTKEPGSIGEPLYHRRHALPCLKAHGPREL